MSDWKAITALVADHLRAGVTAGAGITAYAASTLGIDDAGTLRALIENDAEGSGLAGMILYPDDSLRIVLEPLVPAAGFDAGTIERITRGIAKSLDAVPVTIAGSHEPALLPLTADALARYVNYLRLDVSTAFLAESLPGGNPSLAAARILLRRCGYPSTPGRDRFLAALLRSPGVPELDELLSFALRSFTGDPAMTDPRTLFCSIKRAALDALDQAARFTELSRRYSMDILMSQRVQPPVTGVDEARRTVELCDRVCMAVYGMTSADIEEVPY